ncbi:hypothetical protein TNIN_206841 [Trichonephila inaurata madagascariensis]|uniref:Uncharacterized protein n=1 Tax=Trichonephila inaurata madagascariensis TaxID=2747483 RepID=A0A8X6WL10_9ARAC|nr:hypothetical protein TNIN_206841 [Trichonephila inaurata madagascariensis]
MSNVIKEVRIHNSKECPKQRAANSTIIPEIERHAQTKTSPSNASLVKYSRGHSKETKIKKPIIPPRLLRNKKNKIECNPDDKKSKKIRSAEEKYQDTSNTPRMPADAGQMLDVCDAGFLDIKLETLM